MKITGAPFVVQVRLFYTGYGMAWLEKKLYRQYLKSEHWKKLRWEAIERYGNKCHRCECPTQINVHHKVYRTPWESCTTDDLEVICRRCHRLEHGLPVHDSCENEISVEEELMDDLSAIAVDLTCGNSRYSSYDIALIVSARLLLPNHKGVRFKADLAEAGCRFVG